MRHILFLTSLLLVLAMSFSVVSADTTHQDSLTVTATGRSNVRVGPGPQWKRADGLEVGDLFVIDGTDPTKTWVRGITSNGKVGWVIVTALSISSDEVKALPVVAVDAPFNLAAPPGGSKPSSTVPTAAPPANQPAPPAQLPAGGLAAKVTTQVNLRAEPTRKGQVLAALSIGTDVSVDGRDATQTWIRASLANGTKGWAIAQYFSLNAAQVASLPVVEGGASGAVSAVPANNTAPNQPTPAPIVAVVSTGPVRGFSYGGQVAGLGAGTVSAMQYAGMTWAKRQVRYTGGDPSGLAGLINETHAAGFRVLLSIVGEAGAVTNDSYFDQYAAYVGGAAAQGADAIEVWNEQNIDREWAGGNIDPARYTQLLRKAYGAIKAANPNTLVITGAPAPTGYFGGCSPAGCDDLAYINGMARAGAASVSDCIGLHYNEGILSPTATSGDPRGASGYYTRYFYGMLNTYARAFGNKPLCFTEIGYLTPEGFPPLPGGFAWAQNVTVAQQASWLDQAVALSRNSGRVRLLIIWNVDFTGYGDDPMGGYAIIRPGGGCPACDALAR